MGLSHETRIKALIPARRLMVLRPSHVLKAMGLNEERIASAVRISWGPGVTGIPANVILDEIGMLQSAAVTG